MLVHLEMIFIQFTKSQCKAASTQKPIGRSFCVVVSSLQSAQDCVPVEAQPHQSGHCLLVGGRQSQGTVLVRLLSVARSWVYTSLM